MSDTFEHENNPQPEQDGQPAAQEPAFEVTAVQFPKIDPSDLPVEDGASERDDGSIPDIPLEEEELPMLEEDAPVSKGKLYDFVAKMDDKQFRRAQMIFGIVVGLVAAVCLSIPMSDAEGNSSMWNFVIALVVVMWVPRIVEKRIEKRIPVAQKWMLIMVAVGILVSLGISILLGAQSALVPGATTSQTSVAPTASVTPTASVAP